MEGLYNRFPHLASNILNEISDESLFNCKKSSREMNNFIVSEKFFWIRIIRYYGGNLVEFKESWKKTINKSSVNFVMELSQATFSFLQRDLQDLKSSGTLFLLLVIKNVYSFSNVFLKK